MSAITGPARRSGQGEGRHADDGTVDLRDSVASPRRRRGRLAERGPAGPGLSARTAPAHPPLRGAHPGALQGGLRARTRAREHRPGRRRGRRHVDPDGCRQDQRHPPRPPSVPRQVPEPRGAGGLRPARGRLARGDAGGRAPLHGRDHGALARLLRRTRRLDAHALGPGRRARHQRDRRRQPAAGDRLRAGREAAAQRQPHRHLLRRRRDAERRGLRIAQHGRALRPADHLLRREQSLRRLHPCLRDHAGDAAQRAGAGARGALGRGRRHGRDGGAQGDAVGARPDRSRQGACAGRIAHLPLLPPARADEGQRLRLSRQGRGGGLARPRPGDDHAEAADRGRRHGRGRRRGAGGAGPHRPWRAPPRR